jgi:hypothetical protein
MSRKAESAGKIRAGGGALGLPRLLLLCVAFTLVLSACGGGRNEGEARPLFILDVAALGERLYTDLEYRDQLEELEPEIVFTLLGINSADVTAQKNYFSSGATAEEIVVLQAPDRAAALRLKEALAARIKDQQEVYASYAPAEVAYLEQAILEDKENYVVYCVPVDAEAAARLIAEALELS